MRLVQGVDVHAGYGKIDWEVASQHVDFAYIKCTTGNDRGVDAQFAANVQGCKDHKVPYGSYHFAYPLPSASAHPGRSPCEQAQRAWRDAGEESSPLPHAVDMEWPSPDQWAKWQCTPAQMSEWFREYCEEATRLWGRKPVIYTYPWWMRSIAKSTDVSWMPEYDLWIASYSHNGPGLPSGVPTIPLPWQGWKIWQYSADGSNVRIPGIPSSPIDRDCMYEETLTEYVRAWNP